MVKFSLLTVPVIIVLVSVFLQCGSPEIAKERNTLKPYEQVGIGELKEMVNTGNIIKTRVNIRGIVINKFICPPCPEGYDCEMCPPDHIVVSDGKISITINCRPENFSENEEYCFSLEVKKYPDGFPFQITGWEKNPGNQCKPCKQDINE